MDDRQRVRLNAAGIDTEEALARFMGNEALMMKFLLRFPQDPSFQQLKESMDRKDAAGAFAAAHTLKGVVGNLSMKELFRRVSDVVEDLRGGDLASAEGKMEALEAQYRRMAQVLSSEPSSL